MSNPQAPCGRPPRTQITATLASLEELRDRIARLADEREDVLVETVAEIGRRARSEDVIRILLPEAGISRNTYYPRRDARPAGLQRDPTGQSLIALRERRRELETEIDAAKDERNRTLREAEGLDAAPLAAAAGVTETWVRSLRRTI